MLVHLGQCEAATLVLKALLRPLEDGIRTADMFDPARSTRRATTEEFARAVIAGLGQSPERLRAISYKTPVADDGADRLPARKPAVKEIVGLDVFLQWSGGAALPSYTATYSNCWSGWRAWG